MKVQTVALIVAVVALVLSASVYLQLPPKPRPTIIKCHSEDALSGESWEINLEAPLGAQGCQWDDKANDLVCERKALFRCNLP